MRASTLPLANSTKRASTSSSVATRLSDAPVGDGAVRRQRQKPETRAQMLERLTNPLITLHEASVLLKVCSATVRHYSDNGALQHQRTAGGQRRFYLRDVLNLMRERESRQREARSGRRHTSRSLELEKSERASESRLTNAPSANTLRVANGARPAPTSRPLPTRPTAPARPPAAGERPSSLVLRAGLRNARRS